MTCAAAWQLSQHLDELDKQSPSQDQAIWQHSLPTRMRAEDTPDVDQAPYVPSGVINDWVAAAHDVLRETEPPTCLKGHLASKRCNELLQQFDTNIVPYSMSRGDRDAVARGIAALLRAALCDTRKQPRSKCPAYKLIVAFMRTCERNHSLATMLARDAHVRSAVLHVLTRLHADRGLPALSEARTGGDRGRKMHRAAISGYVEARANVQRHFCIYCRQFWCDVEGALRAAGPGLFTRAAEEAAFAAVSVAKHRGVAVAPQLARQLTHLMYERTVPLNFSVEMVVQLHPWASTDVLPALSRGTKSQMLQAITRKVVACPGSLAHMMVHHSGAVVTALASDAACDSLLLDARNALMNLARVLLPLEHNVAPLIIGLADAGAFDGSAASTTLAAQLADKLAQQPAPVCYIVDTAESLAGPDVSAAARGCMQGTVKAALLMLAKLLMSGGASYARMLQLSSTSTMLSDDDVATIAEAAQLRLPCMARPELDALVAASSGSSHSAVQALHAAAEEAVWYASEFGRASQAAAQAHMISLT